MLITIKNLINAPVMSLQTGQPLAHIDSAIVDPRNLKIVAFYVSGPLVDFSPAVLFATDIREFGYLGAIIDSTDKILPIDDLVRLQEVIDFGFSMDGLRVIDEHKTKLGRVENYTLDPESFFIQQIYAAPTFLKSFGITNLTISRNQIISVDNSSIIVKGSGVKSKTATAGKPSVKIAPIENPFRKPSAAPNASDADE